MRFKRAQAAVEYLILFGFVAFFVIVALGLASLYSNKSQDNLRMNQVQNIGYLLVDEAQQVFYSGKPSRRALEVYFPDGLIGINIISNEIVMNVTSSSGINIIGYLSKVPIEGNLSNRQGVHIIQIVADTGKVLIYE